jgi:hypothetical protein
MEFVRIAGSTGENQDQNDKNKYPGWF